MNSYEKIIQPSQYRDGILLSSYDSSTIQYILCIIQNAWSLHICNTSKYNTL